MANEKLKPVVVTTEHKGVFFGYVPANADTDQDTIRITDARMCVYWSTDIKGVLGLAAKGPNKSCRVGPKVPGITLRKVTAVIEASEEATSKWEAEPWKS